MQVDYRHKLAFDFARTSIAYDEDGRMLVRDAPLSKAMVSDYYGHEIPGAEALGWQPDRLYALLRDPNELERAAASFNEKPLLAGHQYVTAADHRPDVWCGMTGGVATFDGTYLRNSLVVCAQDAIDSILDKSARELSCGYHYRVDPRPGTFKGRAYVGRMTNIRGQHVALVPAGRCGPECFVGDARPQSSADDFYLRFPNANRLRLGASC